MAASGDLCTLTEVKQYLELTGSEHDDRLSALISAASEAIENFCRRRFTLTEYTEYQDGLGSRALLLDHHPVDSVSEVVEDADRDFEGATPLDSDDYVLYPSEGLLLRVAGVFSAGLRNVRVKYTAGHAEVPDDVKQACIVLTAAWFNRARQGADGIERETLGDYSAEYAGRAIPGDVMNLLAPHLEPYV